jgi:hypothetical protein
VNQVLQISIGKTFFFAGRLQGFPQKFCAIVYGASLSRGFWQAHLTSIRISDFTDKTRPAGKYVGRGT